MNYNQTKCFFFSLHVSLLRAGKRCEFHPGVKGVVFTNWCKVLISQRSLLADEENHRTAIPGEWGSITFETSLAQLIPYKSEGKRPIISQQISFVKRHHCHHKASVRFYWYDCCPGRVGLMVSKFPQSAAALKSWCGWCPSQAGLGHRWRQSLEVAG